MTPKELITFRKSHHLTQAQLADILDVSAPAITRWEGDNNIPGPAKKLLRLYFEGIWPFDTAPNIPQRPPLWEVQPSLSEWDDLSNQARRNGFLSTKDFIVWRIRQHIAANPIPPESTILPYKPQSQSSPHHTK